MINLNKKQYKDLGKEIIRKHLVKTTDDSGVITVTVDSDVVMAEFKDRLNDITEF